MPRIGMPVTVTWASGDGVFSFTSPVAGLREAPVPLMGLTLPRQVKRVERRAYARVDVTIVPLLAGVGDQKGHCRPVSLVVGNLSAGGSRVWLSEKVSVGEKIHLTLMLPPDGLVISLVGEVVHLRPRGGTVQRRWEVALRFVNVEPPEMKVLLRFVLHRQRELARKGLMEP